MRRPVPTKVFHFTHMEHLPRIVERGLVSDKIAEREMVVTREVGNRGIKEARRSPAVPVAPGGVVADYVPFYFAARSPMMYAIHKGGVPEYTEGIDPLVYLVSDIDGLIQTGHDVVTTDRNAAIRFAAFATGLQGLNDDVDWQLMQQTMWNNTPEEPDRRERRMAECLVHDAVRWEAFTEIHVRTEARRGQARKLLKATPAPPVHVTPTMYF